jgi:hypothetical protein
MRTGNAIKLYRKSGGWRVREYHSAPEPVSNFATLTKAPRTIQASL